ncbi:hypothetical protein ACLQ24_20370 [Micromonospora sp. DT4]|uniref:hypothetical protein n=1 Tax=Micromonospora sp. DT4 TaxID=3393438 RepID=UPI003CEA27FA
MQAHVPGQRVALEPVGEGIGLDRGYQAEFLLAPMSPAVAPAPASDGVVAERPPSYDEAVRWFDDHRDALFEAVRRASEGAYGVLPWQLALTIWPWLQLTGRFHDWQADIRSGRRTCRAPASRLTSASANDRGATPPTVARSAALGRLSMLSITCYVPARGAKGTLPVTADSRRRHAEGSPSRRLAGR